ncbi:hypothetical protein TBR22_A19050 [Luteitalea sp. TBR-22]|nr:hypothetical protein TBR22_A19050 [Luteitalea sp. TBR-22]
MASASPLSPCVYDKYRRPTFCTFPVTLTLSADDALAGVGLSIELAPTLVFPAPTQVFALGPVTAYGWLRGQPTLGTLAPGLNSPIMVSIFRPSDPTVRAEYQIPLDPANALKFAQLRGAAHFLLTKPDDFGYPYFGGPFLALDANGDYQLRGNFHITAYVAEPATIALLLPAAAVLWRRRRRIDR